MGVGMGIGAFAEGLAGGLALGDSIQKSMDERSLKADMSAAQKETTDKFGPELTDEGYSYMMRKSAAAMMKAGRADEARKFLSWAEDADTKSNTKQFAAGLRQIEMGDLDSFDKTLGKLGSAKGYGPDVGVGFARGEDGKIISNKGADGETYYRLKVTPPGAKEPVLQDVPAGKLKDVYARWFNPQSAYEAERAQAADKSKRDADITDYERKKKIDTQYADPERSKKERVEAIDSLRKRETGGKAFDDLPDTDKETAIQKEIGLRRGTSPSVPPAGPSVVMDRATGQPVKPSAAAPSPASPNAAPGLNGSPRADASAAPGLPRSTEAQRPAGASPDYAPPDDIASWEQQAAELDRKINETRSRSRNPEIAETLISPMQTARADLSNRIRFAKEAQAKGAMPSQRPDQSGHSAEIDEIGRKLGELRSRPGGEAAYRDTITSLESRRSALLEELTAARRTWR